MRHLVLSFVLLAHQSTQAPNGCSPIATIERTTTTHEEEKHENENHFVIL
jgi:hypothetical protein